MYSKGFDIISCDAELINDQRLYVRRLSNTDIQLQKEVIIGTGTEEARILNSFIDVKKITFQAEKIIIEAQKTGTCMLCSEEDVSYVCSTIPQFRILSDDKKYISMSFPNIKDYYALLPYKISDTINDDIDGYKEFNFFMKRLMRCMRKHRKDFPAKDKEYIDFRIVANNAFRKKCINYMINKGMVFTDAKDPHLYKLNTDILAQYGINWAEMALVDNDIFKNMYDDFVTTI